jgi:hypothetical protein
MTSGPLQGGRELEPRMGFPSLSGRGVKPVEITTTKRATEQGWIRSLIPADHHLTL